MSDCRRTNVSLSALSSMRTGGVAPLCCFPETAEELTALVRTFKKENRRFAVLGNLSNVLLPDGVIPFVPIITTKMTSVTVTETADGAYFDVYASCGAALTALALDLCRRGAAGLSFACGIPGTVGGGAYMNAGAYDSETAAVVSYVDVYDAASDTVRRIDKADCGFGYRTSRFQEEKDLTILGVGMHLEKGDAEELTAKAKEFMRRRAEKQPLDKPSCGSAFKRPEGYFAGKLIEDSGLKGFSVGGAQISEKHAGFIVNKGGATTGDVIELIRQVQEKVMRDSGVMLQPEIRVLT